MIKYILFALLFTVSTLTFAQKNTMAAAADSDPEAKAILEKLRSKYEGFKTLEADFTLTIQIPEEPEEFQKGKLVQQEDKYRLELASQQVISDGKTLWLYLPNNNEVQINDAVQVEEEGAVLSPADLLRIYEKGDYVFALTNQFAKDGKLIQQIEFKPLTDDSEFKKLRLSVDKKTNEMVSVETFNKDDSRYTLTVNKMHSNKTYPSSTFAFDKNQYPGVYVEDLRE